MKMPSLNSQAVSREFESVACSRKIKPSRHLLGRLDLLSGGNTGGIFYFLPGLTGQVV